MTRFLLIRHGMTDLVDKAVSGWTPGVHLNDEGRAQAAKLAERLAGAEVKAIYSSPLERARETAEPISRRFGLEVQIVEEVGEIVLGEWTGRELSDLNNEPLWRRFNSLRSLTRAGRRDAIRDAGANDRRAGTIARAASQPDGRRRQSRRPDQIGDSLLRRNRARPLSPH